MQQIKQLAFRKVDSEQIINSAVTNAIESTANPVGNEIESKTLEADANMNEHLCIASSRTKYKKRYTESEIDLPNENRK